MRRLRFLLPVLGIIATLGIASAQAATSATQNVTFSVPNTVSLTSSGDVAGGSLTADTQLASSFTVSSNDTNGITITTAAASATTTEAGTCTPSKSFPAGDISYQAQPLTGQTSGTGGTPPASATSYTTTATDVFTTDPTGVGTTMILHNSYFVNVASKSIPPNSVGCTYTFATTWTIAAK